MKIKVVKYRTLAAFVSACHKNGIRIVKHSTPLWLGDDQCGWQSARGVRVTACSRKSPVLRVWDTRTNTPKNIWEKLVLENFYITAGEGVPEQVSTRVES